MKLLHLNATKAIRNRNIAIYLLAIVFFPGTLFHELTHYISAIFLNVGVGAMRLLPKIAGNEITLGSVQIEHTDPIRRFLIGIAPFITGISTIIVIIHFGKDTQFVSSPIKEIILGFFIFEIANSMFASDKDLEGSLALLLTAVVIIVTLVIIAIRFSISITFPEQIITFFQTIVFYLFFPVSINAFFVGIFLLFSKKRRLFH